MSKIKLKYNHQKNRDAVLRSVGRVADHRRELSDLVFRVAESNSVKALQQRRTQVQGRLSKMLDEIAALRDRFDQQIGGKIQDYSEREALAAAQADERRAEREAAKGKKEVEKAELARQKKQKAKAKARSKAVKGLDAKAKKVSKKASPVARAAWPHPADSTGAPVISSDQALAMVDSQSSMPVPGASTLGSGPNSKPKIEKAKEDLKTLKKAEAAGKKAKPKAKFKKGFVQGSDRTADYN